jgi:hypothetical protein
MNPGHVESARRKVLSGIRGAHLGENAPACGDTSGGQMAMGVTDCSEGVVEWNFFDVCRPSQNEVRHVPVRN